MIRISGKVHYLDRPILSPLTQRPCAYYNFTRKVDRNFILATEIRTNIDQRSIKPFIIKDESGYALVKFSENYENNFFALESDVDFELNPYGEIPDEVISYMRRYELGVDYFKRIGRKLRITEQILNDTDQISVCGLGVWHDTKDLRLNLPVEKVLVITENYPTKLVVSSMFK